MTTERSAEPGGIDNQELESIDLDESDLDELDEPVPAPEPVTYFGSDFDVEGLVRRFERKDVLIPSFGHPDDTIETAGFQRRFVWSRTQMDRFIESLLLGYPIPGIFLVQQVDKRYLVLDGQQRIRSLAAFYEGVHAGRQFSLQNVADEFRGLTYKTLPDDLRRSLDNTFIQATIVKTDGDPKSLDSVYQIFERLNAGGTQLTAHEIRVALYAGPLIEFLTELNSIPEWRSLYGPESPRIRDQELILRFIAFLTNPDEYKAPLKTYLNDFAGRYRDLVGLAVDRIRILFTGASDVLLEAGGTSALKGRGRQVNVALAEALLVGLARRLESGPRPDPEAVRSTLDDLLSDPFLEDVISKATANEDSVRTRLHIATDAFASI